MLTASQMMHAIDGRKVSPDCSDRDAFDCWVCGGKATRGMPVRKWMGANFTGQSRVRAIKSDTVCEACVVVMSGKPPDTERMYSHLVEGTTHVRVNKGQKPTIREFLRRSHAESWFAAIADSGQKHVIPWAIVHGAGRGGTAMFEDKLVHLPRTEEGWSILDRMTDLLTAGATKEEIGSGEYGPRAWSLCAEGIRAFERDFGGERGGHWFELVVWLAQRDEAIVAARLEAEKEQKKEAKRAQRGGKGKAARPDGGRAVGTARGVSPDAGGERAEALGSTSRPDATGRANRDKSGGVEHRDLPVAEGRGAQFDLFGSDHGVERGGVRKAVRNRVARPGRS